MCRSSYGNPSRRRSARAPRGGGTCRSPPRRRGRRRAPVPPRPSRARRGASRPRRRDRPSPCGTQAPPRPLPWNVSNIHKVRLRALAASQPLSRGRDSRAAMDTREIMEMAVRLARQTRVPEDSEIYVPSSSVRRALFGIDADVGTLLAAKQLGYDLVIAHHPLGGRAALDIVKMYDKHATNLVRAHVPRRAALAAVRAMREEHAARVHAQNYDHVPSFARLIGMPLMSIHNPCDEIGRRVMDETMRDALRKTSKVRDAVAALNRLPEFANAKT